MFPNTDLCYSFLLDGKPSAELAPAVSQKTDDNVTTVTAKYPGGLEIVTALRRYPDFDAVEWRNTLRNTGSEPTGVISSLYDCDAIYPFPKEPPYKWSAYLPDQSEGVTIVAPSGSFWSMKEFYADPDRLFDNRYYEKIYPDWESRLYAPVGGRSSNGGHGEGHAPFFNLYHKGEGAIVAVGWTGQWNCRFYRDPELGVRIRSGVEDVNFRLLPGEEVRTSSIVVMGYRGDIQAGQNRWRRFVRTHISPVGKNGCSEKPPFCMGIWGGMTTNGVLARLDAAKKYDLPFEYMWMDAGWYGMGEGESPDEYTSDWASWTGDWRVNPHHHPDGLLDVAKRAKETGKKFLLWFEPERVRKQTVIAKEHPEYFLSHPGNKGDYLLDLGNPEAWEYCRLTVAEYVRRLGLSCYRQDFNTDPLGFWRFEEAEDRRGVREIKYIDGLYRFWDALQSEFPGLLIDDCSSGGRRIDIEMLRRSVPLWRSDAECPANFPPELAQNHTLCFGNWMPYSGTGSGRRWGDPYIFRSTYTPALTTNYTFSERDTFPASPEQIAFLQKYLAEYVRVRDYFTEDIYPLTKISDQHDVWCAGQYDRPGQGDGLVMAFRRDECPYPTAVFPLHGIDASADYELEDLDGGTVTVSGKTLAAGLSVSLEKHGSKLLIYRKK